MRIRNYSFENYDFVSSRGTDGQWYGQFPDLPGSQFIASSRDELYSQAPTVFDDWIAGSESLDVAPPEPGWSASANGVVRIRTQKSLHRVLVERAAAFGVSLSGLVTAMLYAGLELSEHGPVSADSSDCPVQDAVPVYLPKRKSSEKTDRAITGTWVQRIPVELHRKLLWKAMAEGVSVNLLSNILLTKVESNFVLAKERDRHRLAA